MAMHVTDELKRKLLSGEILADVPFDAIEIRGDDYGLTVYFMYCGKGVLYQKVPPVRFDIGETLTITGFDGVVKIGVTV